MNVKSFADAIMERVGSVKVMYVYLADRFYTNAYSKTILPMKVLCYVSDHEQKVVGFNDLTSIFGNKIPYINTNKACIPAFTILPIFCDNVQEYEGHPYYVTGRLQEITSRRVLKACEQLRDKIYVRIRELKHESTLDLSDFAEL